VHTLRVLVIDDQPQVRTAVCEVLRDLGVSDVTEAGSARSALTLVNTPGPHFDLILCDLRMPERDGIEAIRAFAALGVDAAVVIMSVEDDRVLEIAGTLATLQGLRMLGTIQKPVTAGNLAPILHLVAQEKPAERLDAAPAPEGDLGDAFVRRELQLFYQPKIALRSWKIAGVEALIRWKHPTLGMLQPAAFMPALERSDHYSALLAEFSLAEAIAFAGRSRRNGQALDVAINLSVREFEKLDLPERIEAMVAAAAVPARSITLEITETEVARNIVRLGDVAMRLHLKGFTLSVDDFGMGESGLAQLQKAPFTEIKIDREFANGCAKSRLKRSVVEASIALARTLKMTSVAEGVQVEEDLDVLATLNCDIIQGFIFARPMSEEVLSAWVAQWPPKYGSGA
jgi:EAL domain-containing protein (putative c-di-GMP-specific phosphodiesterase class I)/AmiR/NasT family two-component response regulator